VFKKIEGKKECLEGMRLEQLGIESLEDMRQNITS